MSSTAATFCATLVDEWVRAGVTHAVVAPGSRSTPLALALAADGRLAVHVHHDERGRRSWRSGSGLATGRPAVVLTTSGTAAAELHPAVVEAHQAEVPLLAVTADRPARAARRRRPPDHRPDPPLRERGAVVRRARRARRRRLAATGAPWPPAPCRRRRARPGAGAAQPGFREPLVGDAGELPAGRPTGAPWHRRAIGGAGLGGLDAGALAAAVGASRGVIVAGAGRATPTPCTPWPARLRWPVLADPRSRAAGCPGRPRCSHADALLRHQASPPATGPRSCCGWARPPASKVLGPWLAASGAWQIAVDRPRRPPRSRRHAASLVVAEPGACAGPGRPGDVSARRHAVGWLEQWAAAEAERPVGHPRGARRPRRADRAGGGPRRRRRRARRGQLVVSSSMPVRDVEWYAAPRDGPHGARQPRRQRHRRRGRPPASAWRSAPAAPTAVLVGDVAFLHDAAGARRRRRRGVDLTVVVVDNDGGGIFSFLPQAGASRPLRAALRHPSWCRPAASSRWPRCRRCERGRRRHVGPVVPARLGRAACGSSGSGRSGGPTSPCTTRSTRRAAALGPA